MRVSAEHFGDVPGHGQASLWTLDNGRGTRAQVSEWGATLTRLQVPDRSGATRDLVLGFADLASYVAPHPHVGCVVGRVANRVRGARFEIDGRPVDLATDATGLHLHGGPDGLHRQLWLGQAVEDERRAGVRLSLRSADGDQGYPGNMDLTALWWLDADGSLGLALRASADRRTPVNLAQHIYFNLGGGAAPAHRLCLHADRWTPLDADMLPTGEVLPVAGSPFDFTDGCAMARAIDADHPQVQLAGGIDHNFVRPGAARARGADATSRPVTELGWLEAPDGGLRMTVLTDRPCVQVYTGNSLDGSHRDHAGTPWRRHHGVCLETQGWPNAVNEAGFPADWLAPGRAWRSTTRFRFD